MLTVTRAGQTASDVISGKSPLAKHTEFRSFAILNVACNSLSESAKAIGMLDPQCMPATCEYEVLNMDAIHSAFPEQHLHRLPREGVSCLHCSSVWTRQV